MDIAPNSTFSPLRARPADDIVSTFTFPVEVVTSLIGIPGGTVAGLPFSVQFAAFIQRPSSAPVQTYVSPDAPKADSDTPASNRLANCSSFFILVSSMFVVCVVCSKNVVVMPDVGAATSRTDKDIRRIGAREREPCIGVVRGRP